MLWTFAAVLLITWLVAVTTGQVHDGAVHVLLILAVMAALVGFMQRRRHV